MAFYKSILILLRLIECLLVIAVIVATAYIAAVFSTKTHLHGSLFVTWVFGELIGIAILVITFIECIFAWQYDLQPYGYLVFQATKAFLWMALTFLALVVLANQQPQLHDHFFWGLAIPLIVILAIFVAGFSHAYWAYLRPDTVSSSPEADPLLPERPKS